MSWKLIQNWIPFKKALKMTKFKIEHLIEFEIN